VIPDRSKILRDNFDFKKTNNHLYQNPKNMNNKNILKALSVFMVAIAFSCGSADADKTPVTDTPSAPVIVDSNSTRSSNSIAPPDSMASDSDRNHGVIKPPPPPPTENQ